MKFAAGIVIYYPELSRLSESINRLNKQVDVIYIVNNTPEPEDTFVNLIYGKKNTKIKYFSNDSNVGLAKALNQLCELAIDDGYDWLLLLDQDSLISDDFFLNLSKYVNLPKVGLFCPTVIEDGLGTNHNMTSSVEFVKNELVEVASAITSGSFINLNYYLVVGGFYEELFVEGIDNDYSKLLNFLRVKIYLISSNFILHEYGSSEETVFSKFYFKLKNKNHPFFIRRNYSSIRLYYQFRNTIILYRRWKNVDKEFLKTLFIFLKGLFMQLVRVIFMEKKRFKNHIFITKGIVDGLLCDVIKVEAK